MPAAIGAARVPRKSFSTPYTSRNTSTMSASERGSANLARYSFIGGNRINMRFLVLDHRLILDNSSGISRYSFEKTIAGKGPRRWSRPTHGQRTLRWDYRGKMGLRQWLNWTPFSQFQTRQIRVYADRGLGVVYGRLISSDDRNHESPLRVHPKWKFTL